MSAPLLKIHPSIAVVLQIVCLDAEPLNQFRAGRDRRYWELQQGLHGRWCCRALFSDCIFRIDSRIGPDARIEDDRATHATKAHNVACVAAWLAHTPQRAGGPVWCGAKACRSVSQKGTWSQRYGSPSIAPLARVERALTARRNASRAAFLFTP
jgi:hypothetical protein